MASRPGRSRAFLKDRRNIQRIIFLTYGAGDPTGSFFVPNMIDSVELEILYPA